MEKLKELKEFKDSLNTAVFTTKFVVKEGKEIIHIMHYEDDGAWQFDSNDDWDNYEDVVMVVGLDTIIKIDNTVLEVADLPVGYTANRKYKGDKWIVGKI